LWAEAVAFSIYVHNRVLNKTAKSITPFELVLKKKPILAILNCLVVQHLSIYQMKNEQHGIPRARNAYSWATTTSPTSTDCTIARDT